MSKSVPFGILAPATQLPLRAIALTKYGVRLLRTDPVTLTKNSDESIIVVAHSHMITAEYHNENGMPATSLWAQLNAVYSGL